jgi:large subunit ribosomal protein L4
MSKAEATPLTAAPTTNVRTIDGGAGAGISLDPATFGLTPNVALMHQVVTAQLAAARSGTQSTLTRAEVSGGGAKPWRQKGTGRARQGSTRAPHWAGGGVALGPKPRSYRQKTPKKMIAQALRCALSDRAAEGRVMVVEAWSFDRPKTKDARSAITALGLDAAKVLVVLRADEDIAALSFRNLPEVKVVLVGELNAYDILCSDWVVFTPSTLPGTSTQAAAAPVTAAPVATAAPAEVVVAEVVVVVDEVVVAEAEVTDTEPVSAEDEGSEA